MNISLIGALGGKALANSPAPIATAAGLILKQSQIFVTIIGIIAMLSALNAYIIAASRVLQNLSSSFKNRYLNRIKELGSAGTPVVATAIISSIACILLLLFSAHFEKLADIAVIMTLVPYLFICLAAYKLYSNDKKIKIIAGAGAFSMSAIIAIYFIFQVM